MLAWPGKNTARFSYIEYISPLPLPLIKPSPPLPLPWLLDLLFDVQLFNLFNAAYYYYEG
jgi:hypothetical protein